jgi:hypothetical protein
VRLAATDGDGSDGDGSDGDGSDGDGEGPAVLIPTLHAASDRPIAQAIALVAMRRYALIGCPSISLVAASSKIEGRRAMGIAALSRSCDSGRGCGCGCGCGTALVTTNHPDYCHYEHAVRPTGTFRHRCRPRGYSTSLWA